MKILAINGSPNREGTTSKLIDMLLEVCEASGAEYEKVQLEDYTIESCQGCRSCIKGGECCIDDDYLHLKAKMLEVDGIIIGSPYYNGAPVEHLEVFIDRLSVSGNFYRLFSNKYIVGVASSAVNDCKNVAEYCANLGNTGLSGGGIVSGLLYECIVTNDGVKDINEESSIKQRVNEVASKLIKDIKSKNVPFFLRIRRFAFFRQISLCFDKLSKKKDVV